MQGGPADGFGKRMPGLVRKNRSQVSGVRIGFLRKMADLQRHKIKDNSHLHDGSPVLAGSLNHARANRISVVARKDVGTAKK
jgi:hypothetical protein